MLFFFLNDAATTEIYPLSLHYALPILVGPGRAQAAPRATLLTAARRRADGAQRCRAPNGWRMPPRGWRRPAILDRKSTRLNSSHSQISYAVFCLQKNTTPILYTSLHYQ